MKLRTLVLPAAGALLLAACANIDGLLPRAHPSDPNRLQASRTLDRAAARSAPWPTADWWKAYGDAQFDALINEAFAGSPTLWVARARLEQTMALAGIVQSARAPAVSGNGEVVDQRFTQNGLYPRPLAGTYRSTGRLAFDLGYELDFWGKNKAALEAALSKVKAAEVDQYAARLLLSVAIAHAYIELDHQFGRLDIAQASLQSRREILKLTESRVHAGLESEVELKQAAAAVPAAQTEISAAQERASLLRNQLAALLGQGPDRGLKIARPRLQSKLILALPAKLPADLIGRRPEIVAERWRIEAASKEINVAKAQFYPNVNLIAFVGLQSVGLSELVKAGSRMVGIGPAIHLPLFDGGRLRSNLALRNADYDLAVEQYNTAIVNATRDVADQLTSWRAIEDEQSHQSAAQANIEDAYHLALLRYRAGLSNYLTVLTAESQVLIQRRLAADLRARKFDVSVALVRALGGGYGPASKSRISGNDSAAVLAAANRQDLH